MILNSWMEYALGELADHVTEIPGPGSNPRITEYLATTGIGAGPDEIPWCSAFVAWCIERSGIQSTRSAAARSWLTWKDGARSPVAEFGDIAILARGDPILGQGHVGFWIIKRKERLALLGGNQSNAVSIAWYPTPRLIGVMRPL